MVSRRRLGVRLLVVLALLGAFVLNGVFVPAPSFAVAGKSLVLVGGGLQDNNAAVYDKIVALAGGRGVARIGIITAASIPESQDPDAGTPEASNARANGEYYAALFKNTYGAADAQWIPIDLDTISNNAAPARSNTDTPFWPSTSICTAAVSALVTTRAVFSSTP